MVATRQNKDTNKSESTKVDQELNNSDSGSKIFLQMAILLVTGLSITLKYFVVFLVLYVAYDTKLYDFK